MTVTVAAEVAEEPLQPSPGPWRLVLRRFRRHRPAMLGVGILMFLVLVAVLAPLLAPHSPSAQDTSLINAGPSWNHPFGTDDVGRDLLSRLIYGTRISLPASASIVLLATVVALPLGLAAGYAGGKLDALIMRAMDALFAFPPLVLALAIVALRGRSLPNLVIAVAVVFVPSLVRLIRGQVLSVRREAYVEAALSVGAKPRTIVRRHVLPNVASPLVIQLALGMGFALLAEAGLSFLGFGAQPPTPAWGGMLKRSFDFLRDAPYQVFVPGGAITITVLAYNLIGDGLRDALGRESTPVARSRAPRAAAQPEVARADDETLGPQGRPDTGAVLSVENLAVEFATPDGWLRVVDGVGIEVAAGQTVGLVGESGCGKTVSALAVMGLLPRRTARLADGSVRLGGRELVGLAPSELRALRGAEMAMVFQEPEASLNPAFTVGDQIAEAVRQHRGLGRRAAWAEAVEALDRVEIPNPGRRAHEYPYELSGGMRQRAMIAMALSCDPAVLFADEPTTALDVTIQAQILELMRSLQSELGMAVVFITHDLGVVAEICDQVSVMHAGHVVEAATAEEVFTRPQHPYTEALIASLPQAAVPGERLPVIPGRVPDPGAWPEGCRFHPRCPYAEERCRRGAIELATDHGHAVRCVRADELDLAGTR